MAFKPPLQIEQSITSVEFLSGSNPADYSNYELDDLAKQFELISRQGQLMQGLILLEARARFPSDKEFGQWASRTLCSCTPQHRTRLMNFAEFFKNRDMSGISSTAAYLISSPELVKNDIAEDIYVACLNRNLKVKEVQELIAKRKEALSESNNQPDSKKQNLVELVPIITPEDSKKLENKIVSLIDSKIKNPTEAIKLLQRCIAQLKIRHGY